MTSSNPYEMEGWLKPHELAEKLIEQGSVAVLRWDKLNGCFGFDYIEGNIILRSNGISSIMDLDEVRMVFNKLIQSELNRLMQEL